jgi:D-alanine-D-alanine ligase
MRIVVLVDADEVDPADPQFEKARRVKDRSMEFYVVSALRSIDHHVRVMAFNPDVQETIRELQDANADVVFNLTEKVAEDRCKDMHVVALLELLNIPYTGSDPVSMAICRDKALSKQILRSHGLKVPDFVSVPIGGTRLEKEMKFPLLIKPQMGDGSETITLRSLVRNTAEMTAQIRHVHTLMQQPAICEEFIEGRELKVFIIGNNKPHVFPIGEIEFGAIKKGGPTFQTVRVKLDLKYKKKWKIRYKVVKLPPRVESKLVRDSKQIYRLLNLRGYARLDMRLTPSGDAYFLEANPNPSIYPYGSGGAVYWCGSDYPHFLERIVKLALRKR